MALISLVDYKDWWNPPEEMIDIKPKTNAKETKTVTKQNDTEETVCL